MKKIWLRRILISLFLFIGSGILLAEGLRDSVFFTRNSSPAKLFNANDILYIKISSDFFSLLKSRKDPEWQKAVLYVLNTKKEVQDSFHLKIKVRGKFRKREENCKFPPLRLNFRKKETVGTTFEGINKIKIVTHCQPNNPLYTQSLLKEYLAYRIYNVLTDYSFKVRMAHVLYEDINQKWGPIDSYTFFLERDKKLALRVQGEIRKIGGVEKDSVNQDFNNLMSLFQFMIGNNDWSFGISHNIKFIKKKGYKNLIPVPYDFDWAGIINMPYRTNPSSKKEENKPFSVFKGSSLPRKRLKNSFRYFKSKRKEIEDLIMNFTPLYITEKKAFISHVNDFYHIIGNPLIYYKYFRAGNSR